MLAALLIAVFGRYGFPPTLARKAYDAFTAAPINPTADDLNSRLFSLSANGRVENWHTAWQQAKAHPVLGDGPGTYAQFWMQHRRDPGTVHDAHSLYLESLAEMGPLGLLLLLVVFGTPLFAIRRARAAPLVPIVAGAYCAYLLHAAGDWDWELPAVTLTALFCGIALLASGRRDREPRPLRRSVRLTGCGRDGCGLRIRAPGAARQQRRLCELEIDRREPLRASRIAGPQGARGMRPGRRSRGGSWVRHSSSPGTSPQRG